LLPITTRAGLRTSGKRTSQIDTSGGSPLLSRDGDVGKFSCRPPGDSPATWSWGSGERKQNVDERRLTSLVSIGNARSSADLTRPGAEVAGRCHLDVLSDRVGRNA
jgi:hypothetical protein